MSLHGVDDIVVSKAQNLGNFRLSHVGNRAGAALAYLNQTENRKPQGIVDKWMPDSGPISITVLL